MCFAIAYDNQKPGLRSSSIISIFVEKRGNVTEASSYIFYWESPCDQSPVSPMSVICGPWLSQPHQQYSNLRLWLRHPASEPQPRPLKSLRQPPRAQNRQCCFNQLVDICRDSVTRVWRDQVMSPVKMFFDYKLSFVSPKNIFQEELKLKNFLFAKLGITFKGSEWLSFYRLLSKKYIFLYVPKLTCVYWACLKDGPRVKLTRPGVDKVKP